MTFVSEGILPKESKINARYLVLCLCLSLSLSRSLFLSRVVIRNTINGGLDVRVSYLHQQRKISGACFVTIRNNSPTRISRLIRNSTIVVVPLAGIPFAAVNGLDSSRAPILRGRVAVRPSPSPWRKRKAATNFRRARLSRANRASSGARYATSNARSSYRKDPWITMADQASPSRLTFLRGRSIEREARG